VAARQRRWRARPAEAGELAFGTIDTWLAWRLTGGARDGRLEREPHAAVDLHTPALGRGLCGLLRVPMAVLPEVRAAARSTAHDPRLPRFLPDGIPVAGIVGDQQGALFGQACFARGHGQVHLRHRGVPADEHRRPRGLESHNGLLTTVAWRVRRAHHLRARRQHVHRRAPPCSGCATASGSSAAPRTSRPSRAGVPDSGGVYFVPALTGLGAPHWRPDARGIISGITRGTTRAHLARAALDGIALQCRRRPATPCRRPGRPLSELRVDGGASPTTC
jgi:glycerol kinase